MSDSDNEEKKVSKKEVTKNFILKYLPELVVLAIIGMWVLSKVMSSMTTETKDTFISPVHKRMHNAAIRDTLAERNDANPVLFGQ